MYHIYQSFALIIAKIPDKNDCINLINLFISRINQDLNVDDEKFFWILRFIEAIFVPTSQISTHIIDDLWPKLIEKYLSSFQNITTSVIYSQLCLLIVHILAFYFEVIPNYTAVQVFSAISPIISSFYCSLQTYPILTVFDLISVLASKHSQLLDEQLVHIQKQFLNQFFNY